MSACKSSRGAYCLLAMMVVNARGWRLVLWWLSMQEGGDGVVGVSVGGVSHSTCGE